ncbi:hypothetical protein M408DRAFT_265219 [Serendipita vermifera MAFF 305830]|uniref:Uncharacterized protein n=1 Tax=Serendipita vermifera MAFF 305830 TaxID=933852 RepID=A0A0C3AVH7_SERVB|nr:hypothetical protein M408DRAFT_265219 [Serendipita vermifera MAFF 305830]
MPKLTSVIFIQCSRCRASWRKGAEVFAVLRALDLSPNISSIELPPIQEISLRNELKYSQNLNTLRLHGFWPARELESLLQISSTPLITLDVEVSCPRLNLQITVVNINRSTLIPRVYRKIYPGYRH